MENTIPATDIGSEHIQQPTTGERLEVAPLFGDESVSEAQLRGEVETSDQKTTPETKKEPAAQDTKQTEKTTETETPIEKETEKPEHEEEKEAETADETGEAGAQEKPPKGYVPLQALREERHARQALQEESALLLNQAQELQARLQAAENIIRTMQEEGKQIPRPKGVEDFRELSETEFEELMEEDPAQAMKYLHQLEKHREQTKQINEIKAKENAIIQQSYQMAMEQAPEIFSDPQYHTTLIDCATEAGIPKAYLAALTNPNTRLLLSDGVSEVILGPAAAGITLLIDRYYKALNNTRQQETKLRENIKKEVAKELLQKLKTEGGFKNLDMLSTAQGETDNTKGMFTEETYARMSPEQRRAALGG